MNTIEEQNLDFSKFSCCGDEDLYPLWCSECHHMMVFCYECDTLYIDLKYLNKKGRDINHFEPDKAAFSCPSCGHSFEYHFMTNNIYKVPVEEWIKAGHDNLLRR
jgi:hypothetical protein